MRGIAAAACVLMVLAVVGFLTVYVQVHRETSHSVAPALLPGEVLAPPNMENVTPPALAIAARIENGPWQKETSIYPLKGQKVTLKVKQTSGGMPRWYQIVPDISKIYKNANLPSDPNPYKWIGLAKIDYSRRELTRFRGQWEVQPFPAEDSNPASGNHTALSFLLATLSPHCHYHRHVGSFWFQVEVEKDGNVERSSGIEDCDKKGLSPKVFRVSVRDGDGFIGYLNTFFNVPGLFGSIPYQSNNYIGADCCKALLAAYGVWGGKKITKEYSVAMLVDRVPKVAEFNISGGKPDREIRWGKDIHPGNFIAVKYDGAKTYQHIGALHSDADNDGVLSKGDLVLHAGPLPLHYSAISEGCFDGHVVILDHRLRKLAAH